MAYNNFHWLCQWFHNVQGNPPESSYILFSVKSIGKHIHKKGKYHIKNNHHGYEYNRYGYGKRRILNPFCLPSIDSYPKPLLSKQKYQRHTQEKYNMGQLQKPRCKIIISLRKDRADNGFPGKKPGGKHSPSRPKA